MKILITGDRGYIGTELTYFLREKGHDIVGFDLKEGRDIRIQKHFNWTDKDFDLCIHLAGIVGDPNCDANINVAYKTNVEGSRNVVKFCKDNKIPIIFASSCSVYGFIEDGELQNEESKLHPVSFYAYTKVATEEDIKKALPIYTILRFGTVFGWSRQMRYDLVVNSVTKRALKGEKITIYGGEQIRPFIHVQDICRAIEQSMTNMLIYKYEKTNIFNVVNFNITLKRLGEIISESTGAELFIDTSIKDRRSYNVDGSKLYKKGFEPLYTIDDCIYEVKTNEFDKV